MSVFRSPKVISNKSQNSRRTLNRAFIDAKPTDYKDIPFVFRHIPNLSPTADDDMDPKHNVSLRLAVDAESIFRAVFLLYFCTIGISLLIGATFLYHTVKAAAK